MALDRKGEASLGSSPQSLGVKGKRSEECGSTNTLSQSKKGKKGNTKKR